MIIPFIHILVNYKKTKIKIAIGLLVVVIGYIYPFNLFYANILSAGSPQHISKIDFTFPVGAISRKDKQVRSNVNRPSNYIYCSKGDPLYNEAVGGHIGRRVALTKENLMSFEKLRNSLLVLRHIPGFEEQMLRNPEAFEQRVEQYSCTP